MNNDRDGHKGHTPKKQGHNKMSSSGSNSSPASYGRQQYPAAWAGQQGYPATSNHSWNYQGPLQDSTSQQSTTGSYGPSVDDKRGWKQEHDQWSRAQYARDHPGVPSTHPPTRNSYAQQLDDFDRVFGGQGSQSTPMYSTKLDMSDSEELAYQGQPKSQRRRSSGSSRNK